MNEKEAGKERMKKKEINRKDTGTKGWIRSGKMRMRRRVIETTPTCLGDKVSLLLDVGDSDPAVVHVRVRVVEPHQDVRLVVSVGHAEEAAVPLAALLGLLEGIRQLVELVEAEAFDVLVASRDVGDVALAEEGLPRGTRLVVELALVSQRQAVFFPPVVGLAALPRLELQRRQRNAWKHSPWRVTALEKT